MRYLRSQNVCDRIFYNFSLIQLYCRQVSNVKLYVVKVNIKFTVHQYAYKSLCLNWPVFTSLSTWFFVILNQTILCKVRLLSHIGIAPVKSTKSIYSYAEVDKKLIIQNALNVSSEQQLKKFHQYL